MPIDEKKNYSEESAPNDMQTLLCIEMKEIGSKDFYSWAKKAKECTEKGR